MGTPTAVEIWVTTSGIAGVGVERLVSPGVVATTGVVVDDDDLVEVLEVLEVLVLVLAVEVGVLDVCVVEEDEDDGVVDVVGAEGT